MNYCQNCGEKINPNAFVCIKCGAKVAKNYDTFDIDDKGGTAWCLLGFFVPVAGLIIYLLLKDSRPKTALAAGKGALAYLIFALCISIVMLLIFLAFFLSSYFIY